LTGYLPPHTERRSAGLDRLPTPTNRSPPRRSPRVASPQSVALQPARRHSPCDATQRPKSGPRRIQPRDLATVATEPHPMQPATSRWVSALASSRHRMGQARFRTAGAPPSDVALAHASVLSPERVPSNHDEVDHRSGDHRKGFVWRQAGCGHVDSNHTARAGSV
jgi:hypothetical protein